MSNDGARPGDEPRGSGASTAGFSAERIGRNDAIFREANEGISERADDLDLDDMNLPFLCECADPSCTKVLRLSVEEYERVREVPTHFINAIGHQAAAQQYGRVVEECEGYVIVEKLGRAAEVAENLDPRETYTG